MSDNEHLEWMYNRLIEVHGENPNTDYMARMRRIVSCKKWDDQWDEYSNLFPPTENTKKGVLDKWESLGFSIGENKVIEINPKLTNEQMLEMVRKDRPKQVIHQVVSFKPNKSKAKGVLYNVEVIMESEFLGVKIKNYKQELPYPVEAYCNWADSHNDGHL